LIPRSSIRLAAALAGAWRFSRKVRSAVPAWEPLMPAFASSARIALVCLIETPADAATGETYLKDSARSETSALEMLAALAR
jgi:hypothetical protein